MAKTIGMLTGGGDCPGLNAVIRAVVRSADAEGWDSVAVLEGWRGMVEGRFQDLGVQEVSGILPRGGTIIGTSRTNPYKLDGGVEKVRESFRNRGLDALVAIGGEDTLGVAAKLYADFGLPIVGVPKTIDNDLSGTDYTSGFDTRVTVLGHVQRGGSPTPRDRVLATRFGLKAAELAFAGDFGQMAALRGDDIAAVPLAEATAELKTVPPEWYAVAQAFFG